MGVRALASDALLLPLAVPLQSAPSRCCAASCTCRPLLLQNGQAACQCSPSSCGLLCTGLHRSSTGMGARSGVIVQVQLQPEAKHSSAWSGGSCRPSPPMNPSSPASGSFRRCSRTCMLQRCAGGLGPGDRQHAVHAQPGAVLCSCPVRRQGPPQPRGPGAGGRSAGLPCSAMASASKCLGCSSAGLSGLRSPDMQALAFSQAWRWRLWQLVQRPDGLGLMHGALSWQRHQGQLCSRRECRLCTQTHAVA